MGFFEDIAESLDNEGIESRANHGALLVPIAPELDLQFVALDTPVPAANVFLIRTPELDIDWDAQGWTESDGGAHSTLVGVVFSVEAAVAEVVKHISTDVAISVVEALINSTDARLAELDFVQDQIDPLVLYAPVAQMSVITVTIEPTDGEVEATVRFSTAADEGRRDEIYNGYAEADDYRDHETLELGTFDDFDLLCGALDVANQQAESWESMLTPLD